MSSAIRRLLGLLLVGFALCKGAPARGHQVGLSSLLVEIGTNQLGVQMIVAWAELEQAIPMDGNQDKILGPEELAAARTKLIRLGEGALSIDSDGRMLSLKQPLDLALDDQTGLRFSLVYTFPETKVLTITSEVLAELQRGHQQVVTIRGTQGTELGHAVLDKDQPSVDVPLFALKQSQPAASGATDFLVMGIKHILTGWDHLAFLLGLLVIGGGAKEALKIITSFTVAHSISLALATLHLVNIPPRVVEPLIAASIIYVGFENVLSRSFARRWLLTFAFGLIHGCGFASVLREAGIGSNGTSVVTPLVCFNLGVEIGQLGVALLMLPVIWKLKPLFERRWIVATSVLLILLGSYFLVQQIKF